MRTRKPIDDSYNTSQRAVPNLLSQSRTERTGPCAHRDRDDQSAKFWLAPVSLARNLGFGAKELNRIQRLVQKHEAELVEAWDEYHGT